MAVIFSDANSITLKALLIAAIVLILLVPLMMLRSLVSERAGLREQAYARIAQGWGGGIVLGGPILIVPVEETVIVKDVTRSVRRDMHLLPAQLDAAVDLQMQAQPRYVGIYSIPVYLASVRLSGQFDFSALKASAERPGVRYLWQHSRLRLPLSQVGSLREVQRARFAGQDIKLGPAAPGIYQGIEAPIDLTETMQRGSTAFEFNAVIAGSRDFSVLPLGSTTTVALRSNWPHPAFQGAFLPAERSITDAGFDARWQVLELNRSYPQAWLEGGIDAPLLTQSAVGVGLYQTIDVYQCGERAIKYALLFIALTFMTFFGWEQLSGSRLHPMQYLLVGLALSVFYLLLIALSEHIAFLAAYLLAAAALVFLIGIYLAGALASSKHGVVAAAAMTIVYGMLYALVLSEDYALLLGAIILFATLAAVMLATRRIDWYRISGKLPGE